MHPFLTWPGPIPMAHRGGAGLPGYEGLENSLAAFQAAVDLGFTYLETDVHATADGVVLACHDHTLDRTTDSRGSISALSYDVVSRARVADRYPIPTLDELLVAFPEARLNIDAKHSNVVRPLVEVLERTGSRDRVCLASFSDRRLRALRRALGPGLCTSFGPSAAIVTGLAAAGPSRLTGWLARALPSDVACAQLPDVFRRSPRLLDRTIDLLHRRGAVLHVWTVDEPQRMRQLLDAGVDGLVTDRPDLLREVLRERGQWHGPSGNVEEQVR
ncbi:MAG: glycerophosphodiester phosphodiesterase family protein [Actinomycetes bacterium]